MEVASSAASDGPGLGTTNHLHDPGFGGVRPRAGDARAGPLSACGGGGARPRVLVVDDDPGTLRFVRDTLTKAGYAPLVTGAPDNLADLIRAEQPQLVLLDLLLPGRDGIELLQEFRNSLTFR